MLLQHRSDGDGREQVESRWVHSKDGGMDGGAEEGENIHSRLSPAIPPGGSR